MRAHQICFKVKSHCSCMGSEPCHIPTLWEKPHFMQCMEPALSNTPSQYNLKNGLWAQGVDRQTAPAKVGHCFQQPTPQHKRRTGVHPASSQHRESWQDSSRHFQSNFFSLALAFCVIPNFPGTSWNATLAEHARLVGCGSAPYNIDTLAER